MKEHPQSSKPPTASSLFQEESKKISEQIKGLQSHLQKEKEKRLEMLNPSHNSRQPLSDDTSTVSASPEVDCPLYLFLKSLGLDKYYLLFKSNQVSDFESLRNLSESDLERLKIPIGHRLKIIKNLKSLALPQEPTKNPLPVFNYTQADPQLTCETTMSYSILSKVPCWNCFQVHPSDCSTKKHDKNFCSEKCLKKFEESETRTCLCGKGFFRKEGVFLKDSWVCSLCAGGLN